MPTFEINSFSGGMINLVRPDKLEPNQVVDCFNADVSQGGILPLREEVQTTGATEWLQKQGVAKSKSLVKWIDTYYWSDNVTGEVSSDLGHVGLDPPATSVSAVVGTPGDRLVGTFRYTSTFVSAEGFESAPYQLGAKSLYTEINTEVPSFTISLEDLPGFTPYHLTLSARYRAYAYGYAAGDRVNWAGRSWKCNTSFLGPTREVRIPDTFITTQKVLSLELWQYPGAGNVFWTDVSAITETVSGAQEIKLYNIPQPDTTSVKSVRIYRTVANGIDFYLVGEFPVGVTEVMDSSDSTTLLLSKQLDVTRFAYRPVYIYDASGNYGIGKCRYLTEANGTFFLAYKDRVYLSEPANPHSWPLANYLVFDDDVTGIAREALGILVFTKNSTYIVTGTTWQTISSHRLPSVQGCTDWRTITYLRNAPMWMSNDGLCRYAFEPDINGKILRVVSEHKYKFDPAYRFALVANDVYYLWYDDWCVCVDFRNGGSVYRRDIKCLVADYDQYNDVVVILKDDDHYYHLDAGGVLEWKILTKEFLFDISSQKFMRSVWINATSDINVKVIVDGELLDTGVSNGDRYFVSEFGERFQFEFSGTGEFRSAVIEIMED